MTPIMYVCMCTVQESSEEDLTVQGSDSSDDSEEEIDDSASLASSVADLSSGVHYLELYSFSFLRTTSHLDIVNYI